MKEKKIEAEYMTEKVSVNMNRSTLACIDLLVDNGFYSNRSDFINQAVREVIAREKSTLDRIISSNTESDESEDDFHTLRWFIGVMSLSGHELERARKQGKKLNIVGYGLLLFENCDDELIMSSVGTISVRGKVVCSPAVRKFYEEGQSR